MFVQTDLLNIHNAIDTVDTAHKLPFNAYKTTFITCSKVPKKNLHPASVPTLIEERLNLWGLVVRTQRMRQRLRAADLCARLEISEATLRRLERGDAGAGVGLYLMAFQVLGVLDELAPMPSASLQSAEGVKQRVRLPSKGTDGDYF